MMLVLKLLETFLLGRGAARQTMRAPWLACIEADEEERGMIMSSEIRLWNSVEQCGDLRALIGARTAEPTPGSTFRSIHCDSVLHFYLLAVEHPCSRDPGIASI